MIRDYLTGFWLSTYLTSCNDQRLVPGMITSRLKMHDFHLSKQQADNQMAGKSLLHMQTLGYRGK